MFQLGEMKLILINDGTYHVDPGGAFGLVPRQLWSRVLTPDEHHMVPMHQTCMLVQTGDQNILIDTGLGVKLDEKAKRIWQLPHPGGLLRGLATLGLTPEAIDLVINTHLHADHCGGNTRFMNDSDPNTKSGETQTQATFPNAEYVVQRREYEDAMRPNERTRATYHPHNYEPLVETGQMRLLDGDTELAPGVLGLVTPGHTPGHMSVRLESQGQHAAFVCDLASYAVHFERLGWMTAYDVEPLVTLETKRVWQRWALATDALLIFPHDTQKPAGRLRAPEGQRPRVEAEAIALIDV